MKRLMLGVLVCALGALAGCGMTMPMPQSGGDSNLESQAARDLEGCEVDSDCSDNIFCNGIEQCEDGDCVPGHFPCARGICFEDITICEPDTVIVEVPGEPVIVEVPVVVEVPVIVEVPVFVEVPVPVTVTSASRITRTIRQACPSFLDSGIATKITVFDALREEGFSKFDALSFSGQACDSNDAFDLVCNFDLICRERIVVECVNCNSAVIDMVWP